MNVEEIRKEFIELNDKTPEGEMLEIIGATFEADEPSVFGTINQEYVNAELEWYQSEVLNVHKLEDIYGTIPTAWQNTMNSRGDINSNYGYLVYNRGNGYQFQNVVDTLKQDPNSRRAVMIYQRPSMHRDYCENGKNDFVCTNAVQYYIRNDELQVVVQMRSNDVIFGYKNDYAFQKDVQKRLTVELGVPCGKIIWSVANIHVYPQFRHLVK